MEYKTIFTLMAVLAVTGSSMADKCGKTNYSPVNYYCYENAYLCPIITGEVYLRCGDGSCYSEQQYECVNDKLVQKTPQNNAITQYCGSATYSASEYYCFDKATDPFLCPVKNGKTYVRCGQSCYLPTEYGCNTKTGQLTPYPAVPANSYCHHQYDTCEVYVTDPKTGQKYLTIAACCQDDSHSTFACMATKCRNLTALGCSLNGGPGC